MRSQRSLPVESRSVEVPRRAQQTVPAALSAVRNPLAVWGRQRRGVDGAPAPGAEEEVCLGANHTSG